MICERADEVYFGPGDDIFRRGEGCKLGEALMYILLQGAAIVEGALYFSYSSYIIVLNYNI